MERRDPYPVAHQPRRVCPAVPGQPELLGLQLSPSVSLLLLLSLLVLLPIEIVFLRRLHRHVLKRVGESWTFIQFVHTPTTMKRMKRQSPLLASVWPTLELVRCACQR